MSCRITDWFKRCQLSVNFFRDLRIIPDIPDISEKTLPVYFRKGIQELKEQMVLSEANPLEMTFVVDVHTTVLNGEIKGYTVLEIHDSFPRDD
jgi:hypothetical protein